MPSLNAPIVLGSDDATTWEERTPDLGVYDEPEDKKTISRRTSRSIRRRATPGAMTVHISPYRDGLAPETRDFFAELNAEAERLGRRSDTPP